MTTTKALWNQNIFHTIILIFVMCLLSWLHRHSPEKIHKEYDVFYEYTVFGMDTIAVDTIYIVHKEIVK